MNKIQVKRLGLDYKLTGERALTTTAPGTANAYYLSLDRVKVGDILLRDVPAAIIDGEFRGEIIRRGDRDQPLVAAEPHRHHVLLRELA